MSMELETKEICTVLVMLANAEASSRALEAVLESLGERDLSLRVEMMDLASRIQSTTLAGELAFYPEPLRQELMHQCPSVAAVLKDLRERLLRGEG